MARTTQDFNWNIDPESNGKYSHEGARLSVLMDIRDELKKLNAVFACGNFQSIPWKLEKIIKNTTKRKPGRPKKVERKAA